MNINWRLHLAALCVSLVLAGSAFSQGLYWESTTKGGPLGDEGNVSQNYAAQKMFKMVSPSMTMILRMDKETIYTLDPEKKTYTERTFADMEALAKQSGGKMEAAQARLQEKMKSMSPEKRSQMEKMGAFMGGNSRSPVEVSATGEKKTVSGYSCMKYILNRDGKEMMSLWVTKDVSGFDNFRKDWIEFGRRMESLSHMPGMGEAYSKIDGFPMETDIMMGDAKMVTVVTRVESKAIPARDFEVPSGFTRLDSPLPQGSGK